MRVKITYIFLLQFFVTFAFAQQSDIEIISKRLLDKEMEEKYDLQLLEQSLRSMKTDGSWDDISYETTSRYDAGMHLDRLVNMALAYRKQESKYADSQELLDKIIKGLDYFYGRRPTSTNWWHIDIGAPQKYMLVLLLLKDKVDKDKLLHYSQYLEDRTGNPGHKGKNRTWVSAITIYKGCIEDRPDLVSTGFNSIASTIKIVNYHEVEGIKIDNSIHQHRPQLYSGGYGMSFMSDLAEYINLAYGTSFSKLFTPEKIKIISDVMLGGQRMFGYKKTFDFGASGRNISRPNGIENISPDLLDQMMKIDPSNTSEYKAWKDHVNGASSSVKNNKFFWKSDIMTHHGSNYYLSAKILSVRTNGTEMLNGENLKGYYLPLGAINILRSGEEYKNIFPIWDWTRIPGTTSVSNQSTADLRWYHFGSNKFGGGVSNAKNGCIAFEHIYNGVQAKKAYFFIGDVMLCLGAGITAYRTNNIVTTINQCHPNGDIYFSENGNTEVCNKKSLLSENLDWVYHDSIGYIFPNKGKITIQSKEQTGSWNLLAESRSKDKISGDVFSLWFNHGEEPLDEAYSYIVIPNISLKEIENYSQNQNFTILKNDNNIQAAKNKNTYAAVFYKPGSIQFDNDLIVSVDKEALILIEKTGNGYELSVADPLYTASEINITVNKKLEGENVTLTNTSSVIRIELPQGEYTGSSSTKFFNLK
jgi:chondroitin AC lyase